MYCNSQSFLGPEPSKEKTGTKKINSGLTPQKIIGKIEAKKVQDFRHKFTILRFN